MDFNTLIGEEALLQSGDIVTISGFRKTGIYLFINVTLKSGVSKSYIYPKCFLNRDLQLVNEEKNKNLLNDLNNGVVSFEDSDVYRYAMKYRYLFEHYEYDPVYYEKSVYFGDGDVSNYMFKYFKPGHGNLLDAINDKNLPAELKGSLEEYVGRKTRERLFKSNRLDVSKDKDDCYYIDSYTPDYPSSHDDYLTKMLYCYYSCDKYSFDYFSKQLLLILAYICDLATFRAAKRVYLIPMPFGSYEGFSPVVYNIRQIVNWCRKDPSYCRVDVIDGSEILLRVDVFEHFDPSKNSINDYYNDLNYCGKDIEAQNSIFVIMDVEHISRAMFNACKRILMENEINPWNIVGIMPIRRNKLIDIWDDEEIDGYVKMGDISEYFEEEDTDDDEEYYDDHDKDFEDEQKDHREFINEMWEISSNDDYDYDDNV